LLKFMGTDCTRGFSRIDEVNPRDHLGEITYPRDRV
jgi:hypothetical protein